MSSLKVSHPMAHYSNNSKTVPVYEKVAIKRRVHRALDVSMLSLLVSLLSYRLFFLHSHGFFWLQAMAFLCESWFAFVWLLLLATRWNFFHYTKPTPTASSNGKHFILLLQLFMPSILSVVTVLIKLWLKLTRTQPKAPLICGVGKVEIILKMEEILSKLVLFFFSV